MPTPHLHDLAISAVAYDACLVTELTAALATRLGSSPMWAGTQSLLADVMPAPLHEDESRIALVLSQRLWGNDKITAAEAEILRDRVLKAPKSVIVVTLDDEPLPPWMRRLRHRRLGTVGDAAADAST